MQGEVNHEESEHNEVDVMKNGADSTGKHGNSNSNITSSLLGTHSEAVLWGGQGATPHPPSP